MEITREEKIKLERSKRFWSLVIYIPVAVVILWVSLGVFTQLVVSASSEPFNDDFEAYSTGLLDGQGSWFHYSDAGDWFVQETETKTGTKGIQAPLEHSIDKEGNQISIGEWSFWFYKTNNAGNLDILLLGDNNSYSLGCGALFLNRPGAEDIGIYDMAGGFPIEAFDTMLYNEWFKITTQWSFSTNLYRAKLNDNAWSDWYNLYNTCSTYIDGVRLRGSSIDTLYIDDIGEITPPPLVPKVWAISPASETEITDVETNFNFGWEDLDDYDSLSITFLNRPTGIFSQAKTYHIETIGVAGTKELSFSDFNFDRNGKFYFYAIASKYVPTVIDYMYLTGGYSYEWSEDLVDPEYWFTINISGLIPVFEMSDFGTWYAAEAKFATPTALFVSITGFFEPIFNKIGEFGSRIVDYFNVNEAYSQGYEIGKAIPFFAFFVGETSLFLGGFPILKWLFIVMLLLVGIFIFRLILKFIPGLG